MKGTAVDASNAIEVDSDITVALDANRNIYVTILPGNDTAVCIPLGRWNELMAKLQLQMSLYIQPLMQKKPSHSN